MDKIRGCFFFVVLVTLVAVSWAKASQADTITIINQYNKPVVFTAVGTVAGEFIRKGWYEVKPGSVYFFNTDKYSDSTIYMRFQVVGSTSDLIFSTRPTGNYYVHGNAFEVKNVGPGTYFASPPSRVLLSSQMTG
ncbi:MAG: hypothetical protein AB7P69_07655 [Candidatus Binatia bacterium]